MARDPWVLALAWGLVPSPEPREVGLDQALELVAGRSCLERERLIAEVGTWLGRERVDPRLHVRVEGDPVQARRVGFSVRASEAIVARRTFEVLPPACPDAHAVVALAIAIAIDASVLDPLVPDPSPAPAAPPSRSRVVERPFQPPPVRRAVDLALLATIATHLHGDRGLAGGLGAWSTVALARHLDLRAGLHGSWAGPQALAGGQLRAWLGAVEVQACLRVGRGGVFRFCPGMAAGVLSGRARGVPRPATATLPWVSAVAAVVVEVPVARRVAVGLSIAVHFPFVRPRFVALQPDGSGTVDALGPGPVGLVAGVGPVVRLR